MIAFKRKTDTGGFVPSALSPFTFPAGEAHIKRDETKELGATEVAIINSTPESMHTDLFHLAMWNDYIEQTNNGVTKVIVIPYAPGARADRGTPFGARVYAQFIGQTNPDQIIILDPHSPVLEDELRWACGNAEITVVDTYDLIAENFIGEYSGVIAPDKGARTRAANAAQTMGAATLTAGKTRDEATGKLSGFHMEDKLKADGHYLIVDDICDGGGTFMGLAAVIKEQYPYVTLDLFVTHGVFSGKALETLPTAFKKIYTTDSYNPNRILKAVEDGTVVTGLDQNNDFEPKLSDSFQRLKVIGRLLDEVL